MDNLVHKLSKSSQFAKVIAKGLLPPFYGSQYRYIHVNLYYTVYSRFLLLAFCVSAALLASLYFCFNDCICLSCKTYF